MFIVQDYGGQRCACKVKNQMAKRFKTYIFRASMHGALTLLLLLSFTPGSVRHLPQKSNVDID